MKIALAGDYGETVTAHQAIPRALHLAARSLASDIEFEWIHSNDLLASDLETFNALWCVPFSPYQNPLAIIEAINYARVNEMPFLGTCAGFQHAVLEYARNELGYQNAESVEDNPTTRMPLINALTCKLYEQSDVIVVKPETRAAELLQSSEIFETYHCGFGVNVDYLPLFENSSMKFSGFDREGDPRMLELDEHPFFMATAFQPERSALNDITHPLIVSFVAAAL